MEIATARGVWCLFMVQLSLWVGWPGAGGFVEEAGLVLVHEEVEFAVGAAMRGLALYLLALELGLAVGAA